MANINDVPLEILGEIAVYGPEVWRSMLAIPTFGRFAMTQAGRELALRSFRIVEMRACQICLRWESCRFTLSRGLTHSFYDEPAIVHADGKLEWYRNGVLHRDNDRPAVEYPDNYREWYRNGELHRDNDEPAIIYTDGDREWYRNGELHRDNDRPAVERANGHRVWYQNGLKHRDGNKPAIIYPDGDREWYRHGISQQSL